MSLWLLSLVLLSSVIAQDCEWDCSDLDGKALQTFADNTGPGGTKVEITRLDIQTGEYVLLASYPSLSKINSAVFWRDNVTYGADNTKDKLFVIEKHEFPAAYGSSKFVNYVVQLCPTNDTFYRRAVLPFITSATSSRDYYVASTKNDGTMWVSRGGKLNIVSIDLASIATYDWGAIDKDDHLLSPYSQFDIASADGMLNDLAWHEPCQKFVGISSRGDDKNVSDSAVMLFDYDNQSTQSFTFPDGIDGPQTSHNQFGACYTFEGGDAVFCSGNGHLAKPAVGQEEVAGGLYQIHMDPITCEPTGVNFRVPTQPGARNDGTTCRFPGTLPCIPAYAYMEEPGTTATCRSVAMSANEPSEGGSGVWTQDEADTVTVSFSDINDPYAVATASGTGNATLRWTLSAPSCSDSVDEIAFNFGVGCCAENEYVLDNECAPCAVLYVRPAGDDPNGSDTECVWPICPAHSVYINGQCKCVTGYTNDPVWTGGSWTNTCKKICKFCSNRD